MRLYTKNGVPKTDIKDGHYLKLIWYLKRMCIALIEMNGNDVKYVLNFINHEQLKI